MKENFRNQSQREQDFKNRFETAYPRFAYISGYENGQSKVSIMCKVCMTISERSAICVRVKNNVVCNHCLDVERKRKFDDKEAARLERMDLKKKVTKQRRCAYKSRMWKTFKDNKPSHITVCRQCGKEFQTKSKVPVFCSKQCAMKDETRRYKMLRQDRIKSNGPIDKDITLNALIIKDSYICHICNKRVDLKDCQHNINGTFITGRNYPTVDHVIAIANGGTHTWNNVRLAHKHCNSVKSDNNFCETKHGQSAMFL